MGFLAQQAAALVVSRGQTWAAYLATTPLHAPHIARLLQAAAEPEYVAVLPTTALMALGAALQLTPAEFAQLKAGVEADVFLRLLQYHGYDPAVAFQQAQGIYTSAYKAALDEH